MLRCLIIEDEPLGQQVLERYIGRVSGFTLVGKCATAVEAFAALHREKIDLLFLDIRLPHLNGMDFLKSLKHPPLVVFTTAYPEFAAQSYDLEAIDYLLKPITEERFRRCVDKILQRSTPQASRNHLIIKVDGKLIKVALENILYIESLKDYLRVTTTAGMYLTHMTMKAVERLLTPGAFIRVHRSYLISVAKIDMLGVSSIKVGEKEIPIGETYRARVAALGPLL